MTPDEIVSKFSVALDNFDPITDQPSDSDLTRLQEAISPLLLQIPYDDTGGVHNLIGIVRAKPVYLKRYGEAFPEPTRVGAYDLDIDDDATSVVRARLEAAHKAWRADRSKYDTARRETTQFVLAVVADTWVRELKDPETIYTEVDPQDPWRTYKQGAPAGTPLNSLRCIMKCSAIIWRSRASPSTFTCSRTPSGKPAGRDAPYRTKPS